MCSVQRHQFQPKVLPGASQRPRAAAQTKTVGIVGMNCCGKVSLSPEDFHTLMQKVGGILPYAFR